MRVLVGLPLLTVIPEELAFRGVTWALLRRAGGTRVATLGSSALFGLWHVLAALGGGPANETAAGALGEGAVGVAARVAGTVLVTFLAGLLLCGLRGGQREPAGADRPHWAVNGAGIVLVHLVVPDRGPAGSGSSALDEPAPRAWPGHCGRRREGGMTTQPEDLRSEPATSLGGGEQSPPVPDPAPRAPGRPTDRDRPSDRARRRPSPPRPTAGDRYRCRA